MCLVTDVRHIHSFMCVKSLDVFVLLDLQVEPEDVTVWKLWSVVPRGLHTMFNQTIAVWRQVRY